MTLVKIEIDLFEEGKYANVYEIRFEGETEGEATQFFKKHMDNDELDEDFNIISKEIDKILENGALERRFRPEGKKYDNVYALPVWSGSLRLYCIRVSDQILVLGNGDIKDKKTYQESPELSDYVDTLQKVSKFLNPNHKLGENCMIYGKEFIQIPDIRINK